MRAVILGISALATCLAAGLGVLHAADPAPVTIAVVRGDGILIPIVTRTGDRWSHTWPVPTKGEDVPLGLDGIPKRWWGRGGPTTTWHAWQIDGTSSDVTVQQPTWYLAHCQQGIGLRTALTARPPLPPPTVQPYPKLGLAASGRLAFAKIEALDERAPLWSAIRAAVAVGMNKAEHGMDGMPRMNEGVRPRHPFAAAAREAVATRLESLYRAPLGNDRFLYYFEAIKQYGMPPVQAGQAAAMPSPRPDGCGMLTFGRGWIAVGKDGTVAIPEVDARLTSCDYDGANLLLPLGLIADGATPLWIVQVTGWERESYAVLRWDDAQKAPVQLFQTHGGWCAPDE